jgi:hypothetical protein
MVAALIMARSTTTRGRPIAASPCLGIGTLRRALAPGDGTALVDAVCSHRAEIDGVDGFVAAPRALHHCMPANRPSDRRSAQSLPRTDQQPD